ncbi:MAG: glycosyltransferase involved in cell wall biosynthesis [Saprospiraceae bacterium]|jgi:glycosyltransferase involved in cell wall biosynthesis
MRIAFLADPLDRQYGGIHVDTKELLNALSKLDKKNEYIVVRSESKNEFEDMEEIVVPYSSFPGYRFWRTFIQIPRLLSRKRVDIVVEPAHFGPFNLPKNIKRVTVIHDMTVFLFPEHHVWGSQILQRTFFPRILRKADHIITNSSNTTKDLIKYFPHTKGKTTSILLGKDASFKPQIGRGILNKYKIGHPYILFVGTLEPRKNITNIIMAFDEFKTQTGLQHKLVLIGKRGWKADNIFVKIDQSPNKQEIIWLDYLPKNELPYLYSMAEVFIYPSIYEGFGLPVLEAMACGTPVITSETSSLPEIGGSSVSYINPNSIEQLTSQIIVLCSDKEKREKFSKQGIKRAAHFSWKKTAQETINLFEKMI